MDDRGSLLPLEAVLAACIILGGLSALLILPRSAEAPLAAAWVGMETRTQDSLLTLEGQTGPSGGSLLDEGLAEAIACASPAPPALCDAELLVGERLDTYLGPGVHHRLSLSNGAARRTLVEGAPAAGETVTASLIVAPAWNHSFALTSLSCQDPAAPVELAFLPLLGSLRQSPPSAQVRVGDEAFPAAPLAGGPWWNATLPAADSTRTLTAEVAAARRGHAFPATVELRTCPLGTFGAPLREGLASSSFALAASNGVPGGQAAFSYDLRPLKESLPEATIEGVSLLVYEPVAPPAGAGPILAAALPQGTADEGHAVWSVPDHALLGDHPAILRVSLAVPGPTEPVHLDAHLWTIAPVGLSTQQAALPPLYDVSLQAWRSEWR